MTPSRTAILALSFAAIAGAGCRGSQSRGDAAGSGGAGGGGNAGGGGGGSDASPGTACNAANHSYAAVPAPADAGAGSCLFLVPPPSDSNEDRAHIHVRPDDATQIPQDQSHANGWDYADDTLSTIQIFGPTCDAITSGTVRTVCVEFFFISDRNAKRDFARVDRDAILERLSRLPISTWSYKADPQGARHIGPMAQDFKSSFDVGSTDKAIYPLDESGVAFAAIQALDERIKRLTAENASLKKQVAALRAR
jgi:hypothetical protein